MRSSRSVVQIIGAIVSVQCGAALAAQLFDRVGPAGMVLLRLGIAAGVLSAIGRPQLRGRDRRDWILTIGFGVLLATMNLTFYAAVDRLPLGLAVTLELLGPLGLALALSRGLRELSWTLVALVGVVLLGESGQRIDAVGIAFALTAAACWAGYILLNAETGRRSSGVDGLALAMVIATAVAAPFGIAAGGSALLRPSTLAAGFGVAMLSSVINFCLELAALRNVSPRMFGVLMSLSPVVATIAGLVVLGQHLDAVQLLAVACVIAASVGTVSSPTRRGMQVEPQPTADAVGNLSAGS